MNKGKFGLSILAIIAITIFGLFTTFVIPLDASGVKKRETPVSQTMKVISKEELTLHASKDSCYLLIHGYVYDVTGYALLHPGGEVIFQGCGRDATDLYENRWIGSGTIHSAAARQLLVKYKIGTIESNL